MQKRGRGIGGDLDQATAVHGADGDLGVAQAELGDLCLLGQDEAHGGGAGVAPADRVRRARGDDDTFCDDGDPVGEHLGLVHVVRRQEHGAALAGEAADDLPRLAPGVRVESRRRLVQKEQLGVPDEGESEIEPALQAT